jgi:DNA-binding transcriptional regulator YiaG
VTQQTQVPGGGERCFFCGSNQVHARKVMDRVQFETIFGMAAKEVHLPALVCAACGQAVIGEEGQELRDQIIAKERRERIAAEILQIRGSTALTRNEWLALTRIGDASLSRWENASLEPNAAYANYLFLLSYRDNLHRLKSREVRIELESACLREEDCKSKESFYAEAFPGSSFTQETLELSREFDPSARELMVA